MANDGSEGKMISRPEAQQMLSDYRNSPAFAANDGREALLFGRNHIDAILAQPGCIGIRVYYGKDGPLATDPAELIIVGTDVDGNDMTGLILDAGKPCPPYCSSGATKL